jgi:eukaryotic-like serine/threonine-protein kinase
VTHDTGPVDEYDSFARTLLGEDTRLADLDPTPRAPGERRPSQPPAPRPARDVVLPSGNLEGIIIAGRYRLGPEIGKGGMGRIHRGWYGDREIAVKLFRPHPRFLRMQSVDRLGLRFLREAVVAASLTSPNTITVMDAGQTGDGVLFIVMEYLEGTSVWARLQDKGPFDVAVSIHVTRQICRSLEELHRRRYVHRDVKPHNVMLVQRGTDRHHAKLLDFGLVRKIQQQDDYGALTMPGTAVGTPAFSAPEQLLDGDSVDERADVYTLGLLLFTMIAGRPPFVVGDPREIMIAQARSTPPTLLGLRPDLAIPRQLQRVVDRALAKKREDRHDSARSLSEALAAVAV